MKNILRLKIWLSIFGLLLGGCVEQPFAPPGPVVRPGLVMIPADQIHYYQSAPCTAESVPGSRPASAASDVSSVETAPEISVIQINRYADPARPDELMHEAHMIYRREGSPRWRLQNSANVEPILIGPQVADGRGEIKPLASQELKAFLSDQRAHSLQEQDNMAKLGDSLRALGDEQKRLQQELLALRATSAHGRSAAEIPASPDSATVPTVTGPSTAEGDKK